MIQFQELYQSLPHKVSTWSLQDVLKWLMLNGMNSLCTKFEKAQIDGIKLLQLNQDIITKQLKISSKLFVKRLIQWVIIETPEYDKYVENQKSINATELKSKKEIISKKQQNLQPQNINYINTKPFLEESKFQNTKFIESIVSTQKKKNSKIINAKPQLLLKVQNIEYIISDSASIGRNPTQTIQLTDDSVSRLHGRIIKKRNDYFLVNEGKYGTFIQIKNKLEILQKTILLVGQTEILIEKIKIYRTTFDLYVIIDGNNKKQFQSRSQIVLGKKSKDIDLNDNTISNYHGKIMIEDGKIWIKKTESSLYRKLHDKQLYKLENDKFKMGNAYIKCQKILTCQQCKEHNQFSSQNCKKCSSVLKNV